MALVIAPAVVYDAFAERQSRLLWVADSEVVAYPEVRTAKLERRAHTTAHTGTKDWWGNEVLLLKYDQSTYEEEQRLVEATKSALAAKTTPPPRKDVYVKGAMDWERNAWKVWDKKKVQEEQRRDKYSSALVGYLAGHKLVSRFEPPAVTQCAHCDIGGGIHPLRRCMGCMAVSYCCRLHQKVHWQWHKHICFAIRAANNLEAKRGEGAGYCKLRPRRWRRPPIENGCIVETNCRARWANWKQFYTNGAQSMLNQMGDGGPFVFKEWDEAVASMAMCEEATFVFSVGATQRAMMPFVACRKAPPGTVLVVEVGLINVKREGGRRQEVNEFLTQKFVAEQRQKKLDRLDEQKFLRLRMKQDRKEKADSVMKLLKANLEEQEKGLDDQKDAADVDADKEVVAVDATQPPPAQAATAKSSAPTSRKVGAKAEAEEWEEAPELDYEGFGEADDFFAQEGDGDAEPLNLPSAFDDDEIPSGEAAGAPQAPFFTVLANEDSAPFLAASTFDGAKPGYVFKSGAQGSGYYRDQPRAPWLDAEGPPDADGSYGVAPWDQDAATKPSAARLSAPPASANDPWAAVDGFDPRSRLHEDIIPAAAAPPTPPPPPSAGGGSTMHNVLGRAGLAEYAPKFEKAKLLDASAVSTLRPKLAALPSPLVPALHWTGRDSSGRGWTGRDWTGLDVVGLDWTGPDSPMDST